MNKALIAGTATLLLAGTTAMAREEGNVDRGKEKATQVCAACHTVEGVSKNPIFPNLGGQYEDYMVHALQGYKAGTRQNGIMQGITATLSEQDIADVATYYASQPGVLKKAPD